MIWKFPRENILSKSAVFVQAILDETSMQINFNILSDKETLKREIKSKIPYRPQFLLAGFDDLSSEGQLYLFGIEEQQFLEKLDKESQIKSINQLIRKNTPCIILTKNVSLPEHLLEILNQNKIAILTTESDLITTYNLIANFLNDQFAPQMVVYGTFVDVYGVGILFYGKSAIGKSELALDLVERGHRLVADDTVMLTNNAQATIMGTSTRIAKHFMEIRGLGIIDVRAMFGIKAVRFQKRLEIIVELVEYDPQEEYTRTGLEPSFAEVMGVRLDYVKLPIYQGKNITVISEAIALNYLLRTYGYNPAKIMSDYLNSMLLNEPVHEDKFASQRLINYFQGDKE